jgi:hypothetical protein
MLIGGQGWTHQRNLATRPTLPQTAPALLHCGVRPQFKKAGGRFVRIEVRFLNAGEKREDDVQGARREVKTGSRLPMKHLSSVGGGGFE